MSNEVEIEVDVDVDTSGFGALDQAMSRISSLAASALGALTQNLSNAGAEIMKFGSQALSGAAGAAAIGAETTVATGGLNLLVGALLAAAGAAAGAVAGFFALGPALSLVGGLAGAAVSGIFGLVSALATLKIGLGGITEAWGAYGKASGGGGGGGGGGGQSAEQVAKQARTAARAIENAEYSLVQAKRAAVEASEDVNEARKDEIERLQDLDLALRGSKISQNEAAQALREAVEKNRRAQQAGSEWEKAQAANAVERAKYQYDSVTEKLGDLQKEKAKADKDGVEGSDKVQDALQRQKQAQERVTQASKALADAQQKVGTSSGASGGGAAGGVNQFAEAMSKLSPNAQKLVYALIDISKRFDVIKRQVQDRLLAGFDVAVTELADKWLPRLLPMLGGMADALNRVGRNILKAFGDSTFIRNVEKASESFEIFLGYLGDATVDLIDAFGRIAGASTPVLEKLGEIIADIADSFDDWITAADKSGALDGFMEAAAMTLQDIYDIAKLVVQIVGDVIEILFPGSQKAGNSVLDKVKEALESIRDWLASPENQEKLRNFVEEAEEFFERVVRDYIPDMVDLAEKVHGVLDAADDLVTGLRGVGRGIRNFVTEGKRQLLLFALYAIDQFERILDGASTALGWIPGIGDKLKNAKQKFANFRADVNRELQKIRDREVRVTIRVGAVLGQLAGQLVNSIGDVGKLISGRASGGIAGGLTMVGEQGRELVRLPHGSQVIPNGTTEAMMSSGGGGGSMELLVSVRPGADAQLTNAIVKTLRFDIRKRGKGDVQEHLGGKKI